MQVKYNSLSGVQPKKAVICSNTVRKTNWKKCIDIWGLLMVILDVCDLHLKCCV